MKVKLVALLSSALWLSIAAAGQSPDLYQAARTNNVKLTQALIDRNVDVNQKDGRGYTPLILATYNQSPEVSELLLEHGADTERGDATGRTALMGAAFQGDDQCVLILLNHGARIDGVDANGATALMYAVQFGRTSVVRLLIARRADPAIQDKRGFDSFYLAQQLEDPAISVILKTR
jgi:ankyrin repeat protein